MKPEKIESFLLNTVLCAYTTQELQKEQTLFLFSFPISVTVYKNQKAKIKRQFGCAIWFDQKEEKVEDADEGGGEGGGVGVIHHSSLRVS